MPAAYRILFVSHHAARTGAPIGLLAFMRWLRVHTDYQMGTVLRAPGPLVNSFRELGPTLTLGCFFLDHVRFGRRFRGVLPRRLWEAASIRRMFSKGAYDLIYSNTMTNGAVLQALASFQVPIVTHSHELEYWIRRAGPENLRQVLTHSTAFIAASQAVRDNLTHVHRVVDEKISTVHEHIRELPPVPSTDEKLFARNTLGISPAAFVVGSCGAEHWRKGRDIIPQLLIALRRHRPQTEFHFLWVGLSGTEEEEATLRYDLCQAELEDCCHFTGEVADPFAHYPAMDVFALLSRDDPYPLACLEAAAMEKPVVCFADAGGMPEFVRDGCGFVVPYLDIVAMAEAIVCLADDPALVNQCGRCARAKVARENTPATTAPRLKAIIETALGSSRQ